MNIRILAEAVIALTVPTIPRAVHVGARVSAPLRRGAAPYADGCERILWRSHLISLPIFGDPSDLRRGIYVTFRAEHCTIVPSFSLTWQSPAIATPLFWTDFGTIMLAPPH